jgi:hypothetical protein
VSDFIRILLAVTNATSPIKFLYIVLFLSSELPRERFFHRSRGMEQSENIHALYAFDFFRSGFFDGPQANASIVTKRGDFIGSACRSLTFIINQ